MSEPRGVFRATNEALRVEWQRVSNAPFNLDLELAVIGPWGPHALVFPCRRILHGWVNAATNERVAVYPTHWREWKDASSAIFSLVPTPERGSKF